MNDKICLLDNWNEIIGTTCLLTAPIFSSNFNEDEPNPPPPPVDGSLLQENGYALLNQSGGLILL